MENSNLSFKISEKPAPSLAVPSTSNQNDEKKLENKLTVNKEKQKKLNKKLIDKTLQQSVHTTVNERSVNLEKSRINSSKLSQKRIIPATRPTSEKFTDTSKAIAPEPTEADKKKWTENALFENGMQLAYSILPVIPKQNREIVHQWLMYLRKSKQYNLRNEYLALLLTEMKEMKLKKPFSDGPPRDQLKSIWKSKNPTVKQNAQISQYHLMEILKIPLTPAVLTQFKGEFKIPHKFFDDQPMPNNGIVCYGACFSRH